MAHRRTALWLVSSLALVTFACNKDKEQPAPAPSASAALSAAPSAPAPRAAAAEKPRGPERGPGHGGVDAPLFRAVRSLPLRDDQKAKIASLQNDMRDRETDPRDAMTSFSNDLAAQVRAGKIDATKLQPDEAALDAAMKKMLAKQATALGGLHDALDAGQRKALVDAVHAKAAEREEGLRDAGAAQWAAHKLERLTADLGLAAEQQKQVAAILTKQSSEEAARGDAKKQVESILAAFQAESFDAAKALEPTLKAPHDALDRQIALTAKLLTVVHPDQRDKLAASTTKALQRGGGDDDRHHGGGGGGGGGNGGGGGGDGDGNGGGGGNGGGE